MNQLYFCMIPYFVNYDGTEAPEVPECMNFLPVDIPGENGETFELLFGALSAKRTLPAQVASASAVAGGFIQDATVVFCAKADTGAIVTVGWYSHANITPVPELLPMSSEDGGESSHPFFFCTHRHNACLLPEDERFKPQWQIPRNKSGAKNKFGFSADPFWCADEPAAASFCRAFLENIAHYAQSGDNLLTDTDSDDSTEE
ncbi:MAG: hypothetical protein IJ302_00500 [Clostridia bacterium]|nr:hypothetical protein [Clostridia bacterium]